MLKYGRSRHRKGRLIKKLILIGCILFCAGVFVCFKNNLCKTFYSISNGLINITDAYIKTVTIIGASPKVEKLIRANLGVKTGDSIFSVSTTNMLNNLSKIGWIKDATIHKILPNAIKIKIKERTPIAVYHNNKKYTLVDEAGILIADTEINPGLPLISGTDANFYVNNMLTILQKYPTIKIHALMYIQKRRWNLILKNKTTIKLPDRKIEEALKILSTIIDQKNIIDVVTAVDLRTPGNAIMCGLKKKSK